MLLLKGGINEVCKVSNATVDFGRTERVVPSSIYFIESPLRCNSAKTAFSSFMTTVLNASRNCIELCGI